MIIVVDAKCERCGESNPGALDHYLMRGDGDKIQSICKNAVHCQRRQEKHGTPK